MWRLAIWWSLRRKVNHQWCGDCRYRSARIHVGQEVRLDRLEERIKDLELKRDVERAAGHILIKTGEEILGRLIK